MLGEVRNRQKSGTYNFKVLKDKCVDSECLSFAAVFHIGLNYFSPFENILHMNVVYINSYLVNELIDKYFLKSYYGIRQILIAITHKKENSRDSLFFVFVFDSSRV
jgi:hypothetical protein